MAAVIVVFVDHYPTAFQLQLELGRMGILARADLPIPSLVRGVLTDLDVLLVHRDWLQYSSLLRDHYQMTLVTTLAAWKSLSLRLGHPVRAASTTEGMAKQIARVLQAQADIDQ